MLIIMNDGSGRIGNKLIFYAQILASSYEHHFQTIYYGITEIDGIVYDNDVLNKYIIKKKKKYVGWRYYLAYIMALLKIGSFGHICVVKDKKDGILFLKKYTSILERKKIFWYGWPYADYSALRKNYNLISKYFRFTDDLITKALSILDKKEDEIICALHIRRGDYRNWLEGAYFFELDTYISIANQIAEKYSMCNVKFVLFSDEDIPRIVQQKIRGQVFVSCNDAILELCMMSMCNLIVSPPSSFSGWASFIGNVPRFILYSKESTFEREKCFVWMLETDGFGNQIQ